MIQEMNVGDWIIKNNFSTFGRESDSTPVVKIATITPMLGRKGGLRNWLINRAYQLKQSDIRVISEEEALRIMQVWEDSGKLSPVANDNTNTKCIREDNGKPKVTYHGRLGWRKPLFMFRMKHPEGGFQAYTCPECGNVHIGKTLEGEQVPQKPHINELLNSFSEEDLMKAVGEQLLWQKEGNANGAPWERFHNATKQVYEYVSLLEGEGHSAWFASYSIVCHEIAKRVYNREL